MESRAEARDNGKDKGWNNVDVYRAGELGYLYMLDVGSRMVAMWLNRGADYYYTIGCKC